MGAKYAVLSNSQSCLFPSKVFISSSSASKVRFQDTVDHNNPTIPRTEEHDLRAQPTGTACFEEKREVQARATVKPARDTARVEEAGTQARVSLQSGRARNKMGGKKREKTTKAN